MSEPSESYPNEVLDFVDTLFEGHEGVVYCPTKKVATGRWQPYFFDWPAQRADIVTHIIDSTSDRDCYIAPSLFKRHAARKAAWKGSNYVWCEFDGNAPSNLPDGIPEPSIKIQSSTKGHEHWYWRLDSFETNENVVSGLSKQLTYTLDADKSGWDSSQVLRPPGTIHHDSGRRVRLLSANQQPYSISDFKNLVEPPISALNQNEFLVIPELLAVVAKYPFEGDLLELLTKDVKHPNRSSALTNMALSCIEVGMANAEMYAVLDDAARRWKKFDDRSDNKRSKELRRIIAYCRGKKEFEKAVGFVDELEPDRFLTFKELRTQERVEPTWVFSDLIAEQSLAIISGLPSSGKTSMSLRLAACAIFKQRFLKFDYGLSDKQIRAGYVSLEMSKFENDVFFYEMYDTFTDTEKELWDENFLVLNRGYPIDLTDKTNQINMTTDIENRGINLLIIDSIKAAGALDDKKSEKMFTWISKTLRIELGVTVLFVHHNRKPSSEAGASTKPKSLADLYGDVFISAEATTVWSLYMNKSKIINVIHMKTRLTEPFSDFNVKRLPGINYEIIESVPEKTESKEEGGEASASSKKKFGLKS